MKTKNITFFIVVVLVVIAAVFTALNGIDAGNLKIDSISDSMKLGLDIEGGAYVVLEADTDETGEALAKTMDQTQEVIRRRVDAMGLTEPNIVREGTKRIRVELPGVSDAQDAIEAIGKTAQLQFVMADGTVILTGEQVKNAELTFDPKTDKPAVALEFNGNGTEAFRLGTKEVAKLASPNNIMPIVLDDEIISAPRVDSEIAGGTAIIVGEFTVDEASNLAALIRGGALPVDLTEVQTKAIGATLGINSLNTSVKAGLIGLLMVLVFMLGYYRIPGFVASIALMLYIVIVLYTLVLMNATLTLPGVAGMVLSIGMAVDANVIIFERIKEEIRNGKTLRAAVDSGFTKALRTIVDANVTTFIAAIVLYYFGLGPIKGFAITLMIGIVASMFTAVVVTKMLLRIFVGMNLTKNVKMYGA
ncbi:MAG TPA: protein translocase subunit SecD [Clostridia bacterium]|nr:protein translocase subunit SecD [Clostridia bacterium]